MADERIVERETRGQSALDTIYLMRNPKLVKNLVSYHFTKVFSLDRHGWTQRPQRFR